MLSNEKWIVFLWSSCKRQYPSNFPAITHRHSHCLFAEGPNQPAAARPPFISKRMENHINWAISQAFLLCDVDDLTWINLTAGRSPWSVLSLWWGWLQISARRPALRRSRLWRVTRNHWTLTSISREMTRTKMVCFTGRSTESCATPFVIYDTHNGTAGGVQGALLPPHVRGATSLFLSQRGTGIYHKPFCEAVTCIWNSLFLLFTGKATTQKICLNALHWEWPHSAPGSALLIRLGSVFILVGFIQMFTRIAHEYLMPPKRFLCHHVCVTLALYSLEWRTDIR